MSYYEKRGCASRPEGVSLLSSGCHAPGWVGASGGATASLRASSSTGQAQGRPRSGFRADCKEETFPEMQRWLCMVCSTQEATGEEMDCKTQQEKLSHPTESSGFCLKWQSRMVLNIFVCLWNLTWEFRGIWLLGNSFIGMLLLQIDTPSRLIYFLLMASILMKLHPYYQKYHNRNI